MKKLVWFVGIIIVLIILFNIFTFTVDETKQSIVLQYGDIKRVVEEAGLHFKIPFIQSVRHMEARLLSYDIEPRKLITADKRRLLVNNYAIWRIEGPKRFKQSMNGRMDIAQTRIDDIVYSNLRNVLANYEFNSIASGKRIEMLSQITKTSAKKLDEYGINLIDVKIKRADLPEANEQAVYDRMKSERHRQADKLRAEGAEASREIKSQADRKSSVIIAEAKNKAESIRGEGDARSLEIYAKAYSKDEEFYKFWRKLTSYRDSLSKGKTTILLSPDSQYLKLLNEGDLESLQKLDTDAEKESQESTDGD